MFPQKSMDFEEALKVVKAVIYAKVGKSLSEAELLVLQGSWDGQTYEDMAKNSPYEVNYLKADVGPKLWKLLSKALEEEVSKKNFRAALEKSQSKDIPHSQAPIASDLVGTTVGGRYKIIELLGKGEYGETFLAEHDHLPDRPRRVIKRLRSQSKETTEKFDREAAVLIQLGEHPQIPTLFDSFEQDGYFYLVQQFIEGHNLSKELKECQPWSEDQVITLLRDILEILKFVHHYKVIHRNINPQNLIRRHKDKKLVLISFGSVKRIGTANEERSFSGSFAYMPPEQAMGFPKLCSDIYAVGIVGIQALTGLHPKELEGDGTDISWRDQVQVSSKLENILDKMVCSNYNARYESAEEALQAVQALVMG